MTINIMLKTVYNTYIDVLAKEDNNINKASSYFVLLE